MAIIRAFRGLRPQKEFASRVASPPYDVLNSEEARELAKGNELSFLHVTKPEIDLAPEIDLYDDRVYAKGAENFRKMIEKGIFFKEQSLNLYIYKLKMGEQEQTGLMTCVSAEDYFNNIIRKHELTRKDKEMDRTRHVDILNANAGPVFLTYRAREDVNRLVERAMQAEPEYDFTASDGVRHTLYRIADSMMTEKLILIFGEIDFLYIADGHHRAASGATVSEWRKKKNPAHTGSEEYNFFLAVLFPHDQLKIMPYNRVVKDLNNLTEHEFLNRVQEKFEVIPAERTAPGEPRNIGMYLAGEWHMLRVKKGTYDTHDPVKSLDVSILMENLLDPVLGIKDPRTDKRIDFIGGIRGTGELEKLVNSGKFKVAFSMYPVTIEQLMNIADASKIMPPKSTWFEPKLRSGLVVHLLW